MKKVLLILSCIFCTSSFATGVDSLNLKVRTLERDNVVLTQKLASIEAKVNKQNSEVLTLSNRMEANSSAVDSLKSSTNMNAENIKRTADKLGIGLKTQSTSLNTSIANLDKSVNYRTAFVICICVALLAIIILCIWFTRKRNAITDIDIKMLRDAQKTLEEQSLKLDNQLIEILEKKMCVASKSASSNTEPDHSLPLKVADEIVRIQNNIDRMNTSDKNVSRLNKALERMKSSFAAYGYEIVDMRGQEYTDNMPFEVRFIPDTDIEEGKRIISGMDRLMVRFNGKMIQAPILAVRQNV